MTRLATTTARAKDRHSTQPDAVCDGVGERWVCLPKLLGASLGQDLFDVTRHNWPNRSKIVIATRLSHSCLKNVSASLIYKMG